MFGKGQFLKNSFIHKVISEDDFIPLSFLSSVVGRPKRFLIDEAMKGKFKVWLRVPDGVESVVFTISEVLSSDIRVDADYLRREPGVIQHHATFAERLEGRCSPGRKGYQMIYLLVPLQTLRAADKNPPCVFEVGYQPVNIVANLDDESGYDSASGVDGYYDFTRKEFTPSVFVTCKEGDDSNVLNENRVFRLDVNKEEIFVQPFYINNYMEEVAEEMTAIKEVLFRCLGLEEMHLVDFPEKLFYTFVVMYRNVEKLRPGFEFDRDDVNQELMLFGISKKSAGYLSTLIINEGNEASRELKKYKKKSVEDGKGHFESLKVMGLFRAFQYFFDKGEEIKSSDVTSYLTVQHNYDDEAARTLSPMVSGRNKSKSWEALTGQYKLQDVRDFWS